MRDRDEAPSLTVSDSPSDTVVYAYGVVDVTHSLEMPPGVDGASVTVLAHEGLGVVVSELSRARFGTEVWRRHADDPVWLRDLARSHHDVLQHVLSTRDVVPLRLPSVYESAGRVREMLSRERATMNAALAKVRGRVEWGVKLYVDPRANTGEGDSVQDAGRPASGRDYLARRSAQSRERERVRAQRADVVGVVHERLSAEAVDAVSNRPQDPALSGRSEPMVLNAAYLVDRSASEQFTALARQLDADVCAEAELTLEVTGPWPAYNFADASA